MTYQPKVFEAHIQPLSHVLEDISNNQYECVSCLMLIDGKNKKVLSSPTNIPADPMAQVFTCQHCGNQSIGVSETFLGLGNTQELKEYHSVFAEWHDTLF